MKKVAILSSGLDARKDRGYENSSSKLFTNLSTEKDLDVYLFKGSGKSGKNIKALNSFSNWRIVKQMGNKIFNDTYVFEYIFFTLVFIFYQLFNKNYRFDAIYTKEPRVSKTLFQLRKLLRGNPRIIFAMGVKMTPEHYVNICDRAHIINSEHYTKAIEQYPEQKNKFFLIANPGILKSNIASALPKEELRKKYDIKTNKVLLSVGAINKSIKRMDYVVDEFDKIEDKDWSLVLVGKPQDKELLESAQNKYGDRFRHFFVDPTEIYELYQMADLFTLASVVEGFGNVFIESMEQKTPIIAHKRDLYRWAFENEDYLVDMLQSGALSSKINTIDNEWLEENSKKVFDIYNKKFVWENQREDYLNLLLG